MSILAQWIKSFWQVTLSLAGFAGNIGEQTEQSLWTTSSCGYQRSRDAVIVSIIAQLITDDLLFSLSGSTLACLLSS